jgi:DNA polymerase
MSESSNETNIAMLRWLVDTGADEALLEISTNRFAITNRKQATGEDTPELSKRPQAPKIGKITASAKAVSLSTAPGAARELANSCSDLSTLKAALDGFEGCDLKRLATNTVFADGNPEGTIMFIGEAPGRDEDLEGRPFVGRAGQLLDMMLGALALDRSKVYITNILPWRPPNNRNPTPEEAAVCLPFLHRQIELVQPRVLVLLGAVSARHLLGISGGIMRARGNWQVYQTQNGGIPAMPTLHPAYLLRQPSAKRLAWRDFLAITNKIEDLQTA